jgi:3-phosphoshikimate 1-carboxyvinyltransferase
MIKIKKGELSGKIDAITSKSMAHRQIICSALSNMQTSLLLPDISDDIDCTLSAIENLGAKVSKNKDCVIISPSNEKNQFFDCMESGTTLRLMLTIAPSSLNLCHFTGRGRLPQRPISQIIDILRRSNCEVSDDKLPLTVKNKFEFSNVEIQGNISSQFISGLLIASVLQKNDVRISVVGNFESKSYVDMTVNVMRRYGIEIEESMNSYFVRKNQRYIPPKDNIIEKDWSNSAFFLTAGAIGAPVTLCGLDVNSLQSDKKIMDIIEKFGAKISIDNGEICVSAGKTNSIEQDMSQIPDLLPILSVLACASKGTSRFYNARRLRLKESDRISASCQMIRSLGGTAFEKDDELIVEGTGNLTGGEVDSFNDHRIAMSASIASIICDEDVIISGENAVNKSYPKFFTDFQRLGGKIEFCTK